jgi:hypothetical protein
MKLDGLITGFLLVVTLGYALLIGILRLFKVFRSQIMKVLGTLLS